MNRETELRLVERRDRGVIRHAGNAYGESLEGLPLTVYMPESGSADVLILASIHGDEAETTVVVSEALRCLDGMQPMPPMEGPPQGGPPLG